MTEFGSAPFKEEWNSGRREVSGSWMQRSVLGNMRRMEGQFQVEGLIRAEPDWLEALTA